MKLHSQNEKLTHVCNFFLFHIFQHIATMNIADESKDLKEIEEPQTKKLVSFD